jgi:hypothetical protein
MCGRCASSCRHNNLKEALQAVISPALSDSSVVRRQTAKFFNFGRTGDSSRRAAVHCHPFVGRFPVETSSATKRAVVRQSSACCMLSAQRQVLGGGVGVCCCRPIVRGASVAERAARCQRRRNLDRLTPISGDAAQPTADRRTIRSVCSRSCVASVCPQYPSAD